MGFPGTDVDFTRYFESYSTVMSSSQRIMGRNAFDQFEFFPALGYRGLRNVHFNARISAKNSDAGRTARARMIGFEGDFVW